MIGRPSFFCSALMCVVSLDVAQLAVAQEDSNLSDASRVEVYKTTEETKLRVFIYNPEKLSAGDERGAIVFFHGGGWRSGIPDQFAPHCRLLASKGMVAITAEYRLTKKHGTPAWRCLEDAKSAMRYVRSNAADLGIGPDRIAVGGGSAGGHLAACIGLDVAGFDAEGEDTSVPAFADAMVLFNPALNIAKLPDTYRWQGRNTKASPLQLVKTDAPPTLIFHGTADKTVRHTQAVGFEKAMVEAGNDCRLVSFEGAGHGFFFFGRGDGSAYEETTSAMVAFLENSGFIEN